MGWHHFSQIVTSHWYTLISNTEDHSFIEIVLVLKFHFEMKVGRNDLVSAQEIAHQLENHLTDEINRENQKSTLAPYLLALKELRRSLQATRQKLNPSERSFSFFAKTGLEYKSIKREAYLLEVLQDTLEEVNGKIDLRKKSILVMRFLYCRLERVGGGVLFMNSEYRRSDQGSP